MWWSIKVSVRRLGRFTAQHVTHTTCTTGFQSQASIWYYGQGNDDWRSSCTCGTALVVWKLAFTSRPAGELKRGYWESRVVGVEDYESVSCWLWTLSTDKQKRLCLFMCRAVMCFKPSNRLTVRVHKWIELISVFKLIETKLNNKLSQTA